MRCALSTPVGWTDGRTDGWTDARTDGLTDGRTDRMDGWTDEPTDRRTDGRMDGLAYGIIFCCCERKPRIFRCKREEMRDAGAFAAKSLTEIKFKKMVEQTNDVIF